MAANLEILKRFYQLTAAAYASGDPNDLPPEAHILTPDAACDEPDSLPYGGVYRGMEEFLSLYHEDCRVLEF